jgi:tetratricopeptide (TPR) repeat protein
MKMSLQKEVSVLSTRKPQAFETLRERSRRALNQGKMHEALALYDEAAAWAERHDEPALRDLAYCGRCAAAIELGREEDALPRMREVLMRNYDDESCFLAAYNIARIYELRREPRKALFYARVAKDRAARLESAEWMAGSHNQMGNLQLAQSFFDEACDEYHAALGQVTDEETVSRALIFDNLGYCAVVQGDHRRGFDLLYRSLRLLRTLGAERYEVQPRSALCYAYMDVDRLRPAIRHGRRALELAEAHDDRHSLKNCLYLLGEAYHLAGDLLTGRRMFERLQTEFYPDTDYLADFLSVIDVRGLVNLRA